MPGESGRVCLSPHGVHLQQDSLEGSVGSAAVPLLFSNSNSAWSQKRRFFNVEAFLMARSPRRDECLVPVSLAFSFGISEAITNTDASPYSALNRYVFVASNVAHQGRACDRGALPIAGRGQITSARQATSAQPNRRWRPTSTGTL